MDLKELRSAYGEILVAYNALFPLSPNIERGEEETLPDLVGIDEGDSYLATMRKLRKAHPELKEAADRSGSIQIWHAGEPLAVLNDGMRERIELAMKFGI
jgi:hypothetical protein